MPPVPHGLSRWIPAGAKTRLRDAIFRGAVARARREIHRSSAGVPGPGTLRGLWLGWGNTGWSADIEYLQTMASEAIRAGSVLECGSGLSTVLLGLLAERHPIRALSLEHHPEWRSRVGRRLSSLGLDTEGLVASPLLEHDGFSWYTPPSESSGEFRLVICDGPPGDTPGGRYGLLPVMQNRLTSDAIILLDDVAREGERTVLDRWCDEFGASFETGGSRGQFARVWLSGTERSPDQRDR